MACSSQASTHALVAEMLVSMAFLEAHGERLKANSYKLYRRKTELSINEGNYTLGQVAEGLLTLPPGLNGT